MPKIKLTHIVSCSSEDPDHIANNLLNSETKKKWKNKSTGESSASVILQLEKSNKISGIDIGNENSSFIEVLVGRSSSLENDYKILLAMSSFMTPIEARNLTNNNRVRMFTYDDLASSIRDEKWDRVKVVCTQPFNKHIQYGLSFITLQGPKEQKQEEVSTLGKFTLRPESPNVLTAGSMFAKRKELTDSKAEMTVAQAIKTSEKPKFKPVANIQSCSKRDSTSESTNKEEEDNDRNRKALFYDSDEEAANDRIDKVMNKVKDAAEKNKETKTPAKKKNYDNNRNSPKPNSSTKKEKISNDTPSSTSKNSPKHSDSTKKDSVNDAPSSSKRKVDKTLKIPKNKKRKVTKPFIELLNGVVFTISGIVNPERATLRTLALSMGAKYRPDWDNTCTHLICAFANTPKFNQVQGKGKIVTKSWIKDCHAQRKRIPWRKDETRGRLDSSMLPIFTRFHTNGEANLALRDISLPWRRYALDRNDQGKSESEDEVEEQEETVDEPEENDSFVQISVNSNYNKADNDNQSPIKISSTSLSGSDTDDEIEKILAKNKKTEINDNNQNNKDDPFNADTDEEELKKKPTDVEEIPKIFQSEIFYIDEAFDEDEKNKLQRLIKAFDGVVLSNLRNIVDFVVTNEDSVEAFKERCSSVKFVNRTWIYECHDVLKRVPYENFLF